MSETIYKIEQYETNGGKRLNVVTPINNELETPVIVGKVTLDSPDGGHTMPFNFPMPSGTTLEEGVEKFEEFAQAALDELRKKAQEAQEQANKDLIIPSKEIIIP